jgi:hypothetical protein
LEPSKSRFEKQKPSKKPSGRTQTKSAATPIRIGARSVCVLVPDAVLCSRVPCFSSSVIFINT